MSARQRSSRASDAVKMSHIQALRAYAAGAVVLYHLSARSNSILDRSLWSRQLAWGATGVDTFFVLSGFIIMTIHRRDISRPSRFRPYAIKRVVRIYPIYWLVLLVALPIYLGGYGEATKRNVDVVARSIFLYPQHPGTFPIINVAWTLSFEIFFYILFGLLIVLPLRWAIVIVVAWLGPCAVVFVSLLAGILTPRIGLLWTFLFSPRNLEFALGALVAVVGPKLSLPRPRLWLLAGMAVIVAVAASAVDTTWVPYASVVCVALPSAVMVTAAAQMDREGRAAPRLLEAVGDASYSLYLIHFGVLTAVYLTAKHLHVVNDVTWPFVLVFAYVVAVTVALFVYRKVEAPVLRKARGRFIGETTPRPPYVPTT